LNNHHSLSSTSTINTQDLSIDKIDYKHKQTTAVFNINILVN